MAQIVTTNNKYEADTIMSAVALALAFHEARDDMRGTETGQHKSSKLTLLLADAMSIVHDVLADEIAEEGEEIAEEEAKEKFEERFGS